MTALDEGLRITPADADQSLILSEQAVVGTAIASRAGAEEMSAAVPPGAFFRPAHATIFAAAARLAEEGESVDGIIVLHKLTAAGDLRAVGGADYLHTCLAQAVGVPAALWHAERVRDAGRQRALAARLMTAYHRATSASFDPDTDYDAIRSLVDEATAPEGAGDLPTFREVLTDAIDSLSSKAPRGLSLPWKDLDDLLLGLSPGQLVVVGARPRIGKSIVGLQLAAHVAINLRRPALLHSAEMSSGELALRLVSAYSETNLYALKARHLSEDDWKRVSDMYGRVADSPLVIDDTPGPTLAHIRARLRGMARTAPAELLCVDYLQLLRAPRAETRERAVAELSWGLKQIAREFKIPVVVMAQLNRGPEQRNDKRPMLADLRESGSIEQDADVVILLSREDVYEQESPRAGEIDFIVAKHRQGPEGVVSAAFQGHYGRIADMYWDDGSEH